MNKRDEFDPEWIESLRASEQVLGTPESEIQSMRDWDLVMREEGRLFDRDRRLKIDRLRFAERRRGLSEFTLKRIDDVELLELDQFRREQSDFWLERAPAYIAAAAVAFVAFRTGSKLGDLFSFIWTQVGAAISLIAAVACFFAIPATQEKNHRLSRICAAGWFALTAMGFGFLRPEPSPCMSLPQQERAACVEDLNQEAEDRQDLDRENDHGAR